MSDSENDQQKPTKAEQEWKDKKSSLDQDTKEKIKKLADKHSMKVFCNNSKIQESEIYNILKR